LVAWRCDFHAPPEIGFQQHRSAGIIAERLRELGYEAETGVAQTGVVGVLRGNQPGPVVMARFDMDALPITEENETDYASQNPGLMHGCSHDGHIAIGLDVATLVAQLGDGMAGALKLVFQRGEEGMIGAEVTVREGVLENLRPDVVLATHACNDSPVGTLDATPGVVFQRACGWCSHAELSGG
jgi:amidohydrolase